MCDLFGRKAAKKSPVTAVVASTESAEARRASNAAEIERRKRAGVAAHVLTSQMGIPHNPGAAKMGEVAQ